MAHLRADHPQRLQRPNRRPGPFFDGVALDGWQTVGKTPLLACTSQSPRTPYALASKGQEATRLSASGRYRSVLLWEAAHLAAAARQAAIKRAREVSTSAAP